MDSLGGANHVFLVQDLSLSFKQRVRSGVPINACNLSAVLLSKGEFVMQPVGIVWGTGGQRSI